jgi:simple sugar transport system ATP-binding protein
VGQQQRLEIVRLLVRGAKALLLDEPTAVLTKGEATALYQRLRTIADGGATVAVVTHHLDEVCAHADEVTVMRAGRVVHHGDARAETAESLARRALGEVPVVPPPPPLASDAPMRLEVRSLSATAGGSRCRDVSFSVRAGEVLGLAGVDGNGQDALVLGLSGLGAVEGGSVRVEGVEVTREDVRGRRGRGLEVVHGDRLRYGLVASATVRDNLVLGDAGGADEEARAARRLASSRAVPASLEPLAGSFSGGNQQKLVLARALDRSPRVLVAAHPTRGIDAAAAAEVRGRLLAAAGRGAALLVVSGDLAELRAVSHRLIVMHRGRVVAELPPDVDESTLGRAMLGGEP